MDKNLFAIVDNTLRTVRVRFQGIDRNTGLMGYSVGKEYTYVTDINFDIGDLAVVETGDDPMKAPMKVVMITGVDDNVEGIEPNSLIEYKFVIGKVDTTHYEELMARKQEIEKQLAKAYQTRMRKQFVEQFLGGADEDTLKKLGY